MKPALAPALLIDLRGLIDAARQHVAQTANSTLTMLYWHELLMATLEAAGLVKCSIRLMAFQ